MRKFSIAFAGLLAVFFSCDARETKPVKQDERSLLWKITRQDMKQPSYLFGTIHLLCAKDYLWTPAMKKSLRACKEVCFEMDMDDPSVMMQVASGMIDNSGKNLKDYFNEEDYKVVERFVNDSLKMNLLLFQQMKPAALQSLFATKAVMCTNPVSYEANIMEEAKKWKKEITGLEEASEQLALFDRIPQDSVISELVAMARDYSKERTEFDRMLQAYKKQDLPTLHQIIEESRTTNEDLSVFLDERNKKWIERMEGKMEQKPIFFAVGAGHLPGENGIIQLLRNNGYEVVPVK
ncbi:MAG TPA: TraB/GumN family protein [Flavipsychrobacter sp.]|nr:TraB/GumN family protein [Flavipsychrobacter sp.]